MFRGRLIHMGEGRGLAFPESYFLHYMKKKEEDVTG